MRANLLNPLQSRHQSGFTLVLLWIGLIWGAAVQAAEFGEAQVASFIGQPLVAEVELTALSHEESGALQVRPSGPDVYRGANIKMDPALSGLHWVIRHRDKRQFLRITTDKPVNTPFLNLFFELGSKTERQVRALTVWLEPDPEPGTGFAAAPTPAPAPTSAPTHASTPVAVAPVAQEETAANNDHPPLLANHAPASRANCSASRQRCAQIDRENRIIRAQIQQLEKSVIVLNETIIGSAKPGAVSKKPGKKPSRSEDKTDDGDKPEASMADASSANTDAEASASADGELFLKKEEPIVAAKKPVAKTWPWSWIALAAGSTLLLLALLALWLRKRKKKPHARSKSGATDAATEAEIDALAVQDGGDGAEAAAAATAPAKGWAKWRQALKQRWPGKAKTAHDDQPAKPGLMARIKLAISGVAGKMRKKPAPPAELEAEPGA